MNNGVRHRPVSWHPSRIRTERGFERIINFSDATVAIAMTLLVLPLVEIGKEEVPGRGLVQLFQEHWSDISGSC